ncbi:MAG: lactate 2-monooxygenase, partial [Frankiaceae bacterium]|nr:lactate 2-monooxygenase [Frankiaceae bacterium]
MSEQPFANYQNEIYLHGLAGTFPELPCEPAGLEDLARERMEPEPFGYVAGSAGTESTARANRAAFDRWRIVPRFLRDVSTRDLSSTILGTAFPAPVALAPVGVQGIVHP